MMGQGGGRGLVIDKIGVVLWCLFGQGGGLRPIVFLARVYLPLRWCWFWFGYLLGHGGGRLRGEIGSGVEVDIAWGFGCAVVGVMLVAMHGGRWWDMRCDIVI